MPLQYCNTHCVSDSLCCGMAEPDKHMNVQLCTLACCTVLCASDIPALCRAVSAVLTLCVTCVARLAMSAATCMDTNGGPAEFF